MTNSYVVDRSSALKLRVLIASELADIIEKESHLDKVDDEEDKQEGSPITRLIDHAMAVSWILGVLDSADSLWLMGLDDEAAIIASLVTKKIEHLYIDEEAV